MGKIWFSAGKGVGKNTGHPPCPGLSRQLEYTTACILMDGGKGHGPVHIILITAAKCLQGRRLGMKVKRIGVRLYLLEKFIRGKK